MPGRAPGIYECDRHCADNYFKLKLADSDIEYLLRGNTVFVKNELATIPPEIDRIVFHKLPS